MDSSQQQLVEKIKSASNFLVTVSSSPSVDQLAACIGLTLLLNKLNKHATAVFSGQIPSTIEFLKPELTIEKNTDSLRDFIIALDRSKADKLRYKLEDQIVKIFITPYRTSISQDDLEFSQGDFNVDVVLALGVKEQRDLDQAITVHGRILHDATVATVNTTPDGGLGAINWHDTNSSSLSEMVMELSHNLGKDIVDNQIATSLLTGIVAETERFSNDKTFSQTMAISAELMAAGANQQLVATKLEESKAKQIPAADSALDNQAPAKDDEGTLNIKHDSAEEDTNKRDAPPAKKAAEKAKDSSKAPQEQPSQEHKYIRPEDKDMKLPEVKEEDESGLPPVSHIMSRPPSMGGTLTANSQPEALDPSTDPMSLPKEEPPLLKRDEPTQKKTQDDSDQADSGAEPSEPPQASVSQIRIDNTGKLYTDDTAALQPPSAPANNLPDSNNKGTLSDIEKSVNSPHLSNQADITSARDQVMQALSNNSNDTARPDPIQALNAQQLGPDLHGNETGESNLPSISEVLPKTEEVPSVGAPNEPAPIANSPADVPLDMPLPPESAATTPPPSPVKDPNAPPEVPPPMMPPSYMNPNDTGAPL